MGLWDVFGRMRPKIDESSSHTKQTSKTRRQLNNQNSSTFARMEILSTFVIICNSFIHGRKEGIVDPLDDDDDDLGV